MHTQTFQVRTADALVTDLTDDVADFAARQGDGLLNVFVPHATAGVALIETGSGTEPDLAMVLDRLMPREDIYRHRHGSTGHGRDHVMPALVSPSLTIPVIDGRLALGTWQSVVLVDPNADNPDRTVRLSFVAG
ncbi:MAG TPA: secondary thiamine-phosphate synthase enzyme YjbQ [Mycobacteriales bacterium]|nr:secondary thiamine-phosphate synthase enzyme YjbQ [Mycobacteriales bacterium]